MYYVLPFGFGDGGPAVRCGEKRLGQKVVPWGSLPLWRRIRNYNLTPYSGEHEGEYHPLAMGPWGEGLVLRFLQLLYI